MDRSDVITLIAESRTQDAYGVWRPVQTRTDVFCQVKSATQTEFFEAGRNGINPAYEFTMFAGDYNGERICEYNGEAYSIYRTYATRNDTIELYVEHKEGVNAQNSNNVEHKEDVNVQNSNNPD